MHTTSLRLLVVLILAVNSGCDATSAKTDTELVEEGKRYELAKDYRAAQISYKSALQQAPDNKEARLLLARAYIKTGQGLDAEKELREAEKLGVSRAGILYDLGEALLLAGKHTKVLQEIQPDSMPESAMRARLTRQRADALYALRQFRDACQGYLQAATLDPEHPQAHWGLASCDALDGDFDQAVKRLQTLVQRYPLEGAHALRLGEMLQRAGRLSEAEAVYSNALKHHPDLFMAWLHRAGIRLAQGKREEAVADVKMAQRLEPKSPYAAYMMALLDYSAGNFSAARDKLLPILNRMQWHYQTVLLYGSVAYQLGEYGNAESMFGRLLPLAPQDPQLLRMLAASQLRQGQSRQALQTLQPLLTKTPDPATLALAGEIYASMGELDKAAGYLEQAMARQPADAALRLLSARVRLARGDQAGALPELQKLAAESPAWGEADRLYYQNLIAQGRHAQAAQELAALAEGKRKDNPEHGYYLAQAALAMGDDALARQHLMGSRKVRSDYFPAVFGLAYLDLKEKRPEAARALFQSVLKNKADDLEAMLGMAAVELAVGKPDTAMQWWERAARAHPRAPLPRLRMAERHLASGRPDLALALTRELLTLAPNNPTYLRLQGRIHLQAGDLASAQSVFTRLADLHPQDASLWLELANIQAGMRNYTAARRSAEHALKLRPNAQEAALALTAIEVAEGKRAAALSRVLELQKRFPDSATVHTLAGDILTVHARHSEAVRAYERAFQLAPSGPLVLSWFKALRGAGQPGLARQKLVEWLQQRPDDQAVRLHLASLDRDTGNPAAALPHYEYLLRPNPDNPLVLNELAIAYQRLKDARALDTAERAYRLAPNPAVADTLAMILLDRGDARRALEVMQKAADQAGTDPEWRLNYVRVLLRNGRTAQARSELQQLARLPAGTPQALEAQRMLATLR